MKAIGKVLFIFFLIANSLQVLGQQIAGDPRVCPNTEVTYVYTGTLSSGCNLQWSVIGGVFPDFADGTTAHVYGANESTKSIKVKWNANVSSGSISIWNCAGIHSMINISVVVPSISLTASPSQLENWGDPVSLQTNKSGAIWSCNKPNCYLSSTTGTSVSASPLDATVYTVTAEVADYVNAELICTEKKSVTITRRPPVTELPSLDVWTPNCQTPPNFPDICGDIEMRCSFLKVILKGEEHIGVYFGCYRYQWQKSNDNVNWVNLEGEVGLLLELDNIPHHTFTYYRRVAIPSYNPFFKPGCVIYGTKYSNSVLVKRFDENNVLSGDYTSDVIVKGYSSVVSQGSTNIKSSSSVKVRSENLIRLDPGFSTENGAEFIIEIGELCQGGTWRTSLEEDFWPAVEDDLERAFKIYPNPISEGTLMFGKMANKYILFDSMGIKIMEGEQKESLDVTGLKKGIYVLVTDASSHKVLIK
jgi:hypothetical protein